MKFGTVEGPTVPFVPNLMLGRDIWFFCPTGANPLSDVAKIRSAYAGNRSTEVVKFVRFGW